LPLEAVTLPTLLEGRNGANRAAGNRPQRDANIDIEALKAWLARFFDTKSTFDN
jgi:hypothetical protein